ncbi:MAG: hypothetical protein KA767_09370 [Saprospiraceae bacterium]|nr:hypothetical protein [Saprospiraceae bacterium]
MTEIIQLTKKQINKNLPKFIGKSINTIAYFAPEKAAKLALDLFCTPRAGKLKEYQLNFLIKQNGCPCKQVIKNFKRITGQVPDPQLSYYMVGKIIAGVGEN